jgi:ABC-type polysaccharide/polyol phosphate export permease
MIDFVKTLVVRRELFANLVSRELKSRYKGSILGFLWSLLTPLFMAVIYVFFLRLLAGRGVPTEEIIIGVFAWQFTAQCVNSGMTCITGNSNLVKKVYFPRILLPAAATAANMVNFVLSLIVQFALVAVLLGVRGAAPMSAWAFATPALVLYHALFNLALALFMAASNVYFRDTQHLVGVLLSAWFFMSPVMYNLSFVERMADRMPALTSLYMLNPVAPIITGYRALILPDAQFEWSAFSIAGLALPAALALIAFAVFRRAQRNFADVL